MSVQSGRGTQWRVLVVEVAELESRLNAIGSEWEVFALLPEIQFEAKVMGTPVPSGLKYRIVLRGTP